MTDVPGSSAAPTAAGEGRRTHVLALVALLLAGAGALTALHPGSAPVDGAAWALLPLGLLLVAASLLVVRFRAGAQEDTVTLVEAVLAVLLFGFAGPQAVLVTAAAATLTAVRRRTPLYKSAFNVAQWAFAVSLGSAVTTWVAADAGLSLRGLVGLALGLVAVWTANNLAFTSVLVLATGRRVRDVLRNLGPVIAAGWLGGFAVNAALGLLYVLAFAATPVAVLVFPVPLVLLHAAYRGYAVARLDRQHLATLHRAAQALSAPVDPVEAVPAFLGEVLSGFDAGTAALVVRTPAGVVVHTAVRDDGGTGTVCTQSPPSPLWSALVEHGAPVRCEAGRGELGRLLRAAGHRSAVSAPVLVDGAPSGCLAVLDRTGVAGLPSGELEVLVALAREAGGSFDKGRLLARMLEDRRRLGEIVGTTSDGILTVALEGSVTSWNPAMERITGVSAAQVVGRPGGLAALHARTVGGVPVDLSRWAQDGTPPAELRLRTPLGERRITCSYDYAPDATGAARTMVVVARDVTPVEDLARLRQEFSRLVEAEAAQRLVVEQLQQAVMPARPTVEGAELGVTYVASDPTSPTGGDLYDCQVLPDGDLHLCVVDVLGHGVGATQDALTVMHTLRTVVLDGTPLQDVVARAGLLLGRQAPELVATVVLARYTPSTGALRVASGGHPPALVVTADGQVRELEAEGGAIGWPGAGSDDVVHAALQPGDSLVLYTDGLIEARKDLVQGLEDLQCHARDVRALPAPELAAALVDRVLQGAARRDDTLALVLRRTPVDSGTHQARWTLDPVPEQAASTRRAATTWLADRGVPTDDASLVLGELLANAVEHARTTVELTVGLTAEGVVVDVRDDGPGVTAVPAQRAPDDAEEGRGLHIVRALSKDVTVRGTSAGSVVRAVLDASRRLAAA
jgi:serine phosphatase RsbU (regulator of sigma subunit)/PAS domain-containing protein/anti-sigma regulatory factor (Ser/Thr protein kinase)